jgi:hypothetical protein
MVFVSNTHLCMVYVLHTITWYYNSNTTVSANKVGVADLLLPRCCEAEPPLNGHGGEGEGRCFLRRTTELLLAGRGGEEKRRSCKLSPAERRSWYFSLTLGLVNPWAALPPPCGRRDRQEGASPRVRRSRVRRHTSERAVLITSEALNRRQIPSVGVFSRRYPWPRGPLRTSGEFAPGRINFLQALVPWWKIFNLGTVSILATKQVV